MDEHPHTFETHLERGELSAAAEWLVRTHGRDVLHLCTAIVRDRGTAEDLAQDAFSKAFTALPDFRGEASARTWLMTIARHRCLDHLRRTARQPWSLGRDEDLREPAQPTTDDALVSDLLERHADLRTGLAALDEVERAMVLLRFTQGLSYDEIADTFGVRSGAVRMRVGRALTKMRQAIEAHELVTEQALHSPVRGSTARGDLLGAVSPSAGPRAPGAPAAAGAPPPAPAPARVGAPSPAALPPAALPPAGGAAPTAPSPFRALAAWAGFSRQAGKAPPNRGSRPGAAAPQGPDELRATRTRAGAAPGGGESFLQTAFGGLLRALEEDSGAEEAFVQRLLGQVASRR